MSLNLSYVGNFFWSWFLKDSIKAGSGRGGPDPAFPPLFRENPASPTFFISFPNTAFLSQKNTLKSLISTFPGVGGWLPDCLWRVLQILKYEKWCPLCEFEFEIKNHTGEYVPYSLRRVYKFFNVPRNLCMQGLWDGAYGLSSLDDKVKLGNTVLCLYPVIRNVFHLYCKVAGVTILSL